MGSNSHTGIGRATRVTKPDMWYYDRLPPTARTALANADHDWASSWLYNRWSKGKPGFKTGQQCAERVRAADRSTNRKI